MTAIINKQDALNNLARAYVAEQLEWKLYMDSGSYSNKDYIKASTHYDTLRSAYLDCGMIEWADIEGTWWHGAKIRKTVD